MRLSLASWPGSTSVDNEDYAVASADAVVVLDGVTPLDRSDTGCLHGVAWYARTLGLRLLLEAADWKRELNDCLAEAIGRTTAEHAEECATDHPDSPAATVAMVRLGEDGVDYLVLADASVLVARVDGTVGQITDRRAEAVGRQVSDAAGTDETSDRLARHRSIRAHRNRPGGYFVAADDPSAAAETLVGHLPREAVAELVVASDGATRPVEVFGIIEWPEVLAALRAEGADGWLARTRSWERSDADCVRWQRGKTYDDATIAHLTGITNTAEAGA